MFRVPRSPFRERFSPWIRLSALGRRHGRRRPRQTGFGGRERQRLRISCRTERAYIYLALLTAPRSSQKAAAVRLLPTSRLSYTLSHLQSALHDYLLTMQLLALALLASTPAAVSAATCSGLSTGAMAAIIVESVVIFLLVIVLLSVLRQLQIARNKLKAAHLHEGQEYKRGPASDDRADRNHSTSSLVQSPQQDNYEESHVALLPPSLRPQSHSFSSPPSVRSSTLYDFTPRQEDFGFDFKSYRPSSVVQPSTTVQPPVAVAQPTILQPLTHVAEVSMASLPNPHSEHGHGGDHDDDDDEQSTTHESLLPTPLPRAAQPSDDSETSGRRVRLRGVVRILWAADVVGALERGPTPISRTTTASTTLSTYSDVSTPITGPVHELLINRQRDSGSQAHTVASAVRP
ncbi:uncharacterized protein B0H18DRAFT_975635 [Fomitopsis serialis]|uniref:uncharacterized protein n=1 Tax=Fomitopsis serialis TaxID=139415 RepID=UPI00200728A9|nr:uncharacterized protein B0H18DRAFT_975635 [Neoantrodia serialis]KAH9935385.1 hypothetical protein B0H18DRAFT_975635 [Neoantrodia serialis]